MHPGIRVERLRPFADANAVAGAGDVVFRQRLKRPTAVAPRRDREVLF
ncbi:MAG: hypothetical protein QOF71_79, partial [Candidatus Eremiobacteraeota bacterium]|nr:hypothetical protein [Candidatus Eremiobacteraeota bacterium]